ncbi:MAG: IS66 family transposase [Myxococcales bacterium]|nr:IS66 family transposase [Myxococcales bacterium]
MTLEQTLQVIAQQQQTIAQQATLITALQTELLELKRRLGLDSHNSHKPPSSDGAFAPKAKGSTKKTGKKRGGQKGHPGRFRELAPAERIDEVAEMYPKHCQHCECSLGAAQEHGKVWRHQVAELPKVRAHIMEYRMHKVRCACCGKSTRASLPADVSPSAFGPHLKATVAELRSVHRMSIQQVVQYLKTHWDLELSEGMLCRMQWEVTEALAGSYVQVLEVIDRSKQAHADETPYCIEAKGAWLWVACSQDAVGYRLCTSRSAEQAKALLGRRDKLVIRDRYGGYRDYPQTQYCWAHLKREWTGWSEQKGLRGFLGKKLLQCTTQMFDALGELRAERCDVGTFQTRMKPIMNEVHRWLGVGQKASEPSLGRQCTSLLKHIDALFRFVQDPLHIPPTNNTAERALRPAVIQRKLSFGVQSQSGARFIERMLSVWQTCKLHGQSVLDYLEQALKAAQLGLPSPRLLPDPQPIALR